MSAVHWEASLFGQISGQATLDRLLERLRAIGSAVEAFEIQEQVFKPRAGTTIEPPTPSMKPVALRLQKDLSTLDEFITYFGVPEVNVNRKCSVLPIIKSKIASGHPRGFLLDLGYEAAYEVVSRGFQARFGPHNEMFLRAFRLLKVSNGHSFPVDDEMWIVHLGSECEAQLQLAERDTLLNESAKIFDDLLAFKHLQNNLFIE